MIYFIKNRTDFIQSTSPGGRDAPSGHVRRVFVEGISRALGWRRLGSFGEGAMWEQQVWAVSHSSREDHTASSDTLRQLVVVAPFCLFIFSIIYFL